MARKIKKNAAGTKQTGVFTKAHGFITEKGWTFLIHRNRHWALKATCELFERQTSDEKITRTTRWDNDRGFNCADASRGAKLAKRIRRAVEAADSFKDAVPNVSRDDMELALFLCRRYRKQCLNIVARAERLRDEMLAGQERAAQLRKEKP